MQEEENFSEPLDHSVVLTILTSNILTIFFRY